MNRLMKAEWYRLKHSNNIWKWLVFIGAALAAMPFLESMKFQTAGEYVQSIGIDTSIFLPVFVIIFSSLCVGFMYVNKTAYYEIMSGNKIHNIIMSKILVDATFISVVVSMCYVFVVAVLGIWKGRGEIDNLPLRLLLLFVVIFHISSAGILIMLSCRQMVGAIVAFLKLNLLDSSIMVWFEIVFKDHVSEKTYDKIMSIFIFNQITDVTRRNITAFLIASILLTTMAEGIFWYVIAYVGMKKKKF